MDLRTPSDQAWRESPTLTTMQPGMCGQGFQLSTCAASAAVSAGMLPRGHTTQSLRQACGAVLKLALMQTECASTAASCQPVQQPSILLWTTLYGYRVACLDNRASVTRDSQP